MQRSGHPIAKPPPKQKCDFIVMMLLAATQALSGTILRQTGFLRTGENLLLMSQETKKSLWKKYAEPSTNLTSRQRLAIMNSRLRDLLLARLVGKQSWQHAPMRIPLEVLCHLMTMGIPRITIYSNRMPEKPVKPTWHLTGSVVYDLSGYICAYGGWSPYNSTIKAITSHSRQPWIAVMHFDGKVWIGIKGDCENLFHLVHSPITDTEKATAISFHPLKPLIAVAVNARIMVYKISQSLKPELHFKASFHESGYYCPRPKFSADSLGWNLTGTFMTAISKGNLSMGFYIKPDTTGVIGDFYGGINYAGLRSIGEDISPTCSCFSLDGKLVITGYDNGTLLTRRAEQTDMGFTLRNLMLMNQFLTGKVDQIVPHPHNHSVFAIGMSRGLMHFYVLIVLVNDDGSVTIIATIPNAKSPHFHEGWFLVSSGEKILFHKMNRCNIPCLVTEFHLQGNGPFGVRIDAFCVITAPDGKVMLYYSISGESKLCTAKIALS
jgi:hypothetical protein